MVPCLDGGGVVHHCVPCPHAEPLVAGSAPRTYGWDFKLRHYLATESLPGDGPIRTSSEVLVELCAEPVCGS